MAKQPHPLMTDFNRNPIMIDDDELNAERQLSKERCPELWAADPNDVIIAATDLGFAIGQEMGRQGEIFMARAQTHGSMPKQIDGSTTNMPQPHTTQQETHTPAPYYAHKGEYSIDICRAWDSDVRPVDAATFGSYLGAHIAKLEFNSGVPTEEQAEANAAFIVTACNSHYALLEACKLALADYVNQQWENDETAVMLRAAVSQVEG
jgi:hypothetical protein